MDGYESSWLTERDRARFWEKVNKNGPIPNSSDPLVRAPKTPCWEWTAARTAGYGVFSASLPRAGKTTRAHRISYMESVGPIPKLNEIDHLCRNRACVNPDHLEPVTKRENLLRGATTVARRSATTHCPRGHEYSPDNTQISKRNQRSCRTCRRDRERERRKDPQVREYYRSLAERHRVEGLSEGDPRHGTLTGYTNWSCRCDRCSNSYSEYASERYRQRKKDVLG